MVEGLEVEVLTGTSETVLRVVGDLDLATEAMLRAPLVEAAESGRRVVVDASGLGFVDSTGLRTLLIGRKHCEAAGSSLVLQDPSPGLRRLVEVAGLSDLLAVGEADS